jgi:site-specific DNA-methyltransferase (adenine-specific)
MKAKSEVFNMDCIEGMKQYPDNYFELAIVDPPYGIGASKIKDYQSQTKDKITKYNVKNWDFNIPEKKYWDELFRVSKNQFVWGGNYFTEFLFPTKDWIVWDKEQPEEMHFAQAELCWCSYGKGLRIFKRSIAKDQNRVSNNKSKALQYCRIHPTQKPIALYKWLLVKYAKEGDKILDTHLGSGSSRIAAYDLGFEFTGFELDEDYFKASEKRFKQHTDQLTLF